MKKNINGILLLDKPIGLTSNGALQRVKHLFHAKKAGHTGSLDPVATGMLPICFGDATKFSQFLLDSDKVYRVTAKLGEKTTTGDSEGTVLETKPVIGVTKERVDEVIAPFLGKQQQTPPMFSAIKHQGKPLYELARKGIEIERKSREINIFALRQEALEGNELTLYVHCSKGTYVRTLVEDIGAVLGCGAHVIALRRLSVSPYSHSAMYTMDMLHEILQNSGPAGLLDCLLPVETSVQVFPAVKLSTAAAFYIRMGQAVRTNLPTGATLVRLLAEDDRFLGMGETLEDGRVKPHRMIAGSGEKKQEVA